MILTILAPPNFQAVQLGSDFFVGLNIVFSGVAALVALLILWFTVVKGPSLELVRGFTATPLEKPPNTMLQSDTMLGLDRIEIRPIGLVFVNDGSRSGAIIDVEPNFVPSEAFKQFYGQIISKVWIDLRDAQQGADLPVIVSSGGTTIVGLGMTIHLRAWKDVARTSQLVDITLEQALKRIWDDGKSSFASFCKFKDEIGEVRLSLQRTRRRWGRIRTTNDGIGSSTPIGTIPKWVQDKAIAYSDRFGDLPPTDGEVARYIRGLPEFFIDDLRRTWLHWRIAFPTRHPTFYKARV